MAKKKKKRHPLRGKPKTPTSRRYFKFDLERIAKHIGKIADNTSLKDIQEIVLNAALAYAGYEAFKDWKGALLGPVSLKLAQTSGGTPPAAQIAGVTGLSIIGVKGMHDWVSAEVEREKEYVKSLTPEQQRKYIREKGEYFLKTGLIYKVSPFAAVLKTMGLIP